MNTKAKFDRYSIDISNKEQMLELTDLNTVTDTDCFSNAQTIGIYLMGEKSQELCKLERAFMAGVRLALKGVNYGVRY